MDRIAAFIDRHGDSRFSNVDDGGDAHVRDRAGWWQRTPGGRLYLFTSDGLKEALKGFDFKRTLESLVQQGVLPKPGADGKRSVVVRIGGETKRLYQIDPAALGDANVS